MYLNAHILVFINGIEVNSIVSVDIKNDSQHIGSSCDIVIPLTSRYAFASGTDLTQQPTNPFTQGMPVKVSAWYDEFLGVEGGGIIDVFEGFIYDFIEDTPLTIRCMDWSYWLNLDSVSYSWKSVTMKNLISTVISDVNKKIAAAGYQTIGLILPMPDIDLVDISFKLMTPAAIIDYFRTELGLNISLLGKELYVNLASNLTTTSKLNTSINVKTSSLQKPESVFSRVKVKAWFYQDNGIKDSIEVGDDGGQLKEVWFNKVTRNDVVYNKLATEALHKAKLRHYSGNLDLFLYPKIDNFMRVEYKDIRYPEKSGVYVVMENNLNFSESGFQRTIRLSWINDLA